MNAIVHGVSRDGTALIIMPAQNYDLWREEEISALLVFLLNQPPIDNVLPQTNVGPLGYLLLGFGIAPESAAKIIDHENLDFVDIAPQASVEYGEYLFNYCVDCHYPNAAGGFVPDNNMQSGNLTASVSGIGAWTMDDFVTALRTGIRPDGTVINVSGMPWPNIARMTDTELQALYMYLRTLEPIENDN